jgi:hypothetical protein
MSTVNYAEGGYRFIPGVFQYSAGVAALSGFRLERITFKPPGIPASSSTTRRTPPPGSNAVEGHRTLMPNDIVRFGSWYLTVRVSHGRRLSAADIASL